MYIFVEEKIKESIENGDFDNLPGKGKPINLRDEFSGMAPEVKQAYRILKKAGYITEDIDNKKEFISQYDLLTSATDGKVKIDIQNRKQFDALAKERKLHTNSKFVAYAKNIYRKLF
ncbi:DUF1992 domain-containing protein [Oceanobacillus rekensis]|uniref:DnaJ family domain-containing protein n=1 Tax=Oceanobacillus rekensis TaxID=937927 RepID=UPI000B447CD4|nr:DUF1992 domain-containing protein [Oceanobacillus rekensis]